MLTFEKITNYLNSINTKLLTPKESYENSYKQKLEFECQKGHKTQKTFKAYRSHGCSICNPKDKKHDILQLKKIAKARGDTILSSEYINARTPLLFKCNNPDHEPYYSLWTTYNRSQCRRCAYEKLKISHNILIKQITNEKYCIITINNFNNIPSKSIIKLQCNKKHKPYTTTWNRWQQGKRCPHCSPFALKSVEEIKQTLNSLDLILVDKDFQYTGNKVPIKVKCKNGHITCKGLQALKKYGCSECSTTGTSSIELALLEHYKQFNPIHKHRIKIPSELKLDERTTTIELDIFFPDQKVALEYCGLYWHGSKRIEFLYQGDPDELNFQINRNKYQHQYKKTICDHFGILLLTIFEDEYLTKKSIVYSYIDQKLDILTKINVDECQIAEINSIEATDFFNKYHIQNATSFEYGLKLSYLNQIIAAIIFEKSLQHVWELKRYCTTFQIINGLQEMFKYALLEAKKQNISTIFTYCDLRWADDTYQTLGFELKEITPPNPYVIKGVTRTKNKNIENKNLIYDCGHQKWIYVTRKTLEDFNFL